MSNFDGTPLSQRLAQGPMAAAEVLGIARAFAEALRRLHDSGVVHGALEPSCVILNESGAVLLHGVTASLTPYSAPEQVQGKSVDARSDIFGLGAILYEALSGRKPFPGEGEELRAAILEREAAPLAGVPAGLERLVLRCLAKAPTQRWQRAQNVQMELKLLDVMARREERGPELQEQRLQAMVRTQIAQVEERWNGRLSALEEANSELRAKLSAESGKLDTANQTASELRAGMAALSDRLEEAGQERKTTAAAAAGAAAELAARLDGLDRALAGHSSAIESLGSALTQSDDLIEHLVDELDALERSLAGRKKTQSANSALSSS